MIGGDAFLIAWLILMPAALWILPRLMIVIERVMRTPETERDKARTARAFHKRLHGFLR